MQKNQIVGVGWPMHNKLNCFPWLAHTNTPKVKKRGGGGNQISLFSLLFSPHLRLFPRSLTRLLFHEWAMMSYDMIFFNDNIYWDDAAAT